MSTHTRAQSRRQWRHPASRSASHRLDKAQGEARRETDWIGIEAPERPSPSRSFGALQGHEYLQDERGWRRCQDGEEFADYLEAQAKRRSWYMGETSRQGQPVLMRRRVKTPVEIVTTTFAPWLSDWTAAQIAAQHDPRPQLAAIRSAWLKAAESALSGERHILGYAFHADTDDLHFDLCLSRQDGAGGRIGSTGLRLVGPWGVGIDRQVRAGARIHAEKTSQLKRSVATFRARYGPEARPLDVTLARALDAAAGAVLGAEIAPYREAYAQKVPELERRHAAAKLAVLSAAEAKLRQRAAAPESTPEPGIHFS